MRIKETIIDFLNEFRRRRIGLLGVLLLVLTILVAVLAPIIAPLDLKRWKDPTYWENNPKSVPPVWVPYLLGKKPVPQIYITDFKVQSRKLGGFPLIIATKEFNYTYDDFPNQVRVYFNLSHGGAGAFLQVTLYRPDGQSVTFYTDTIYPTTGNVTYNWYEKNVDANREKKVRVAVATWLQKNGMNVTADTVIVPVALFSDIKSLKEGSPKPLKGVYKVELKSATQGKELTLNKLELLLGATAYGLLGTDDVGRDLFKGLVWGTPIALMIGVLTSLISVLVGLFYGVASGYIGGFTDEVMMRIVDILMAMPKLPILLMLAIVYKPTVFTIIFLLAIFGWMGISRVSRSIALQLRELAFVEAARAIGASRWRIIGIHIVPNIVPYTVAALALGIPDAILTEASLSFLGLGDPSLPTWGSILHDAEQGGALGSGMWWWFIPPGLAIAIVSMAFVFIGYAIDEIVNPRLRRR